MLSAIWQVVYPALPIDSTRWRAWASHRGFAGRHFCQPVYAPCGQACVPDPLWHVRRGRTLVWGSLSGFCCLSCCWSTASNAAAGAPAPLEDQTMCSRHAAEEGCLGAWLLQGPLCAPIKPPCNCFPPPTAHKPQTASSEMASPLKPTHTDRKSRPGSGLHSCALIQQVCKLSLQNLE